MAAYDNVERERKFDVDETIQFPPLHELPGVDRVEHSVMHHLDAWYFDTGKFALATQRITLRRRTGGDDAGWHLKIPVSSDERREVREPLGEDPNTVPLPLLHLVRVYVRSQALIPVARLQTQRIVHRLRGVHGDVLANFCDDRVQAVRLEPELANLTWREWEFELVSGTTEMLEVIQSVLAATGIRPASYPSKLARVLGDRYPQEEPSAPPLPERNCPAANVLLAYVYEQIQVLMEQDPRVRQDAPDSLHLMRIATRRLRSALTTFRTLLDPDPSDHLCRELKWLASILGAQRDAEVIHRRLRDLIAAEPTELVLELVSRRIDEEFGANFRATRLKALEALDDERYFDLLDDLDALLAAPPLTDLASGPAQKILPELVRNEWKRLRRTVRTAARTQTGVGRDLALHEVRKSAKRLRYAAETVAPLWRKRVTRLADAAENLQTILGDHQDSVVARDLLHRLGIEAHLQGENGFTYGILHALEQRAADDSEIQFFQAWERFPILKT